MLNPDKSIIGTIDGRQLLNEWYGWLFENACRSSTGNEQNLYSCFYFSKFNDFIIYLYVGDFMMWLMLFILIAGYLVADRKKILIKIKDLWNQMK